MTGVASGARGAVVPIKGRGGGVGVSKQRHRARGDQGMTGIDCEGRGRALNLGRGRRSSRWWRSRRLKGRSGAIGESIVYGSLRVACSGRRSSTSPGRNLMRRRGSQWRLNARLRGNRRRCCSRGTIEVAIYREDGIKQRVTDPSWKAGRLPTVIRGPYRLNHRHPW